MLLTALILFSHGIIWTTVEAGSFDYVMPHRRFKSRPPVDPRCKNPQDKHFCSDGVPMVTFDDDDTIVIYSMRGSGRRVPSIDKVMPHHAGIGLHNLNTGFYYTLDWAHMFSIINCSRPAVLEDDSFLWCNQGASCFSSNFSSFFQGPKAVRHPVAKTTGKLLNAFSHWVTWDNSTGIYGDTAHLMRSRDGPYWTESWDCGSFVQRAFQALYDLGVRFYPDFQPTYDLAIAYTYMPEYLGNHTEIFGVDGDPVLAQRLISFFKTWGDKDIDYLYMYYNEAYWYAKFTSRAPDTLTQMVVPLPGYE
ncbi:ceroid-lipofuscinosis neuronal protein 5-like [Haliotis rubra]|uniref:ceroid-lipofuscinosis neuronal protein 5-like n=1 Tax=Haliotis rubra TaxID=36100 RepID=UPI001EE51170|nr:ceroid-lipofuscinosis neuronal protein 5-like [Haliotis rubra]